jgi:hypothetical protein
MPKLNINLDKHATKIAKIFKKFKDKLLYNIISTLIFSFIYWIISKLDKSAFSQVLEYPDALYYSSTTNFTLGFGDVLPVSPLARSITCIHSILFYVITIAA